MIPHARRAVFAVRRSVAVRRRRRWLGRAGNALSDRRDRPVAHGSPVQRIVRHCAGGAGTEHHVCRSAGTFYRGGARRCGRDGGDVRTELHPRLRGVAGCRALSQGALAHCDSGRFGAGDDWTYCCIGLIAASALIIARGADGDWASFAITATTFAVVYWTRLSPLVVFACAALAGLVGFV